MSRELKVDDIVIHFKHETDTPDNEYKYLYQIVAFAMHTETEEQLVIYKNIWSDRVFARPYDMFMSEVDYDKYPDIKQKYRLEKWVKISS